MSLDTMARAQWEGRKNEVGRRKSRSQGPRRGELLGGGGGCYCCDVSVFSFWKPELCLPFPTFSF